MQGRTMVRPLHRCQPVDHQNVAVYQFGRTMVRPYIVMNPLTTKIGPDGCAGLRGRPG